MTTLAAPASLPMVLTEVEVESVERLSTSFVRLTLRGAGLPDVGVAGPLWDQRFKLIVPHANGAITTVVDADEGWLGSWMDRPVEERGHMRTYTVRALVGEGESRRLVVDVVIHPGVSGPGADWAAAAEVGSRAVALLPRTGYPFGGIEFAPPVGADLLLVGDETAVPAVCAILELLPDEARGAAFLEVPYADDIQDVRRPAGVEVTWLAREGRAHGAPLTEAVLDRLGGAPTHSDTTDPSQVDPELWETPTWSSSGEPLQGSGLTEGPYARMHAWIAGESTMVTGLRRHLVKELGVDRSQVAFMGYWRRGVAMKS